MNGRRIAEFFLLSLSDLARLAADGVTGRRKPFFLAMLELNRGAAARFAPLPFGLPATS